MDQHVNEAFDFELVSEQVGEFMNQVSLRSSSNVEDLSPGLEIHGLDYTPPRSKVRVLKNVHFAVPKGNIFSLLGPSGCGKTTLLRCVFGSIRPEAGEILVHGRPSNSKGSGIPGHQIGYMPQEDALYEDMQIGEILSFYAKINGMQPEMARNRIQEMICLLELPKKSQSIGKLSGGQKRRVSFSIALIHQPPLIILDEPTSGVDPLLREKIWTYLVDLSLREKTTIVITTHYIEEARRSNLVAFMRSGKVLLQHSPSDILKRFSNLESAFLALCKATRDKNGRENDAFQCKCITQETANRAQLELVPQVRDGSSLWFSVFIALLIRYLKHDLSNLFVLTFQYIIPLSQVILFAYCVGGEPFDIPLAIVAEESEPDLSAKFMASLDGHIFRPVNYSDFEEAFDDAKRLKVWGVLHFKKSFSQAFMDRLLTVDYGKTFDFDNSMIQLIPDATDKLLLTTITRYLQGSIARTAFQVIAGFGNESANMQFANFIANPVIKKGEAVYGRYKESDYSGFRDFMFPGLAVNLMYATSYSLLAILLVKERLNQSFERIFVAGVSPLQILLAMVLGRTFFSLPLLVLMIVLPVTIFNFPTKLWQTLHAMPLLISINMAGLSHGIIIAVLCSSLEMTAILASATLFSIIFISGTIWPIEAISKQFRVIAKAGPTTLAIEGLRNVLYREWSAFRTELQPAYLALFIWTLIPLFIGVKFLRFN